MDSAVTAIEDCSILNPTTNCLSQFSFKNRVTISPPGVINLTHGEKVDEEDIFAEKETVLCNTNELGGVGNNYKRFSSRIGCSGLQ